MNVGYARTSTFEQQAGLDAQIRDLKTAGVKEIYSEQVSSLAQRRELDAALKFARKGDTLCEEGRYSNCNKTRPPCTINKTSVVYH